MDPPCYAGEPFFSFVFLLIIFYFYFKSKNTAKNALALRTISIQ